MFVIWDTRKTKRVNVFPVATAGASTAVVLHPIYVNVMRALFLTWTAIIWKVVRLCADRTARPTAQMARVRHRMSAFAIQDTRKIIKKSVCRVVMDVAISDIVLRRVSVIAIPVTSR